MNLHNLKREFYDLIKNTSDYYKINETYVEKDYFVFVLIKEINLTFPHVVFKGGTSLSKCYGIINRISEDIDLSIEVNYLTPKYKRSLKKTIVDSCEKLNLQILNIDNIRSRRDFNRYEISYNPEYINKVILQKILVETTYISKTYPILEKETKCFIYDYLEEIGRRDLIEKFDVEPFKIKVQSLERTFIDKIFALCDSSLKQDLTRSSRHIYDLYKIYPLINIDETLKDLFNKVKEERKLNKRCISAQDGFDVGKKLKEIVALNIFEKDYKEVTSEIIYDNITYSEAILVLEKICNEFLL